MEALKKLIQDALTERWPEIKASRNGFFEKPGDEGLEQMISFDPPWSVSLVEKDSDRINVLLYLDESLGALREISANDTESPPRLPFQKFAVKDIVNHHGKYLIEHQGPEGGTIIHYWSPSEMADQIENFFIEHEKGGIMDSEG